VGVSGGIVVVLCAAYWFRYKHVTSAQAKAAAKSAEFGFGEEGSGPIEEKRTGCTSLSTTGDTFSSQNPLHVQDDVESTDLDGTSDSSMVDFSATGQAKPLHRDKIPKVTPYEALPEYHNPTWTNREGKNKE